MQIHFDDRRHRALVLSGAVCAALFVGAWTGASVQGPQDRPLLGVPLIAVALAADPPAPPAAVPTPPDAPPTPSIAPPPPPPEPVPAPDAAAAKNATAGDAGSVSRSHGAEITIDGKGIRVEAPPRNGKPGARVQVQGVGEDSDFDSIVKDKPWILAMVIAMLAIVFLSPAIVIAMVIWYKMRRTRMLHETILKLAEKGALPPGDAIEALSSGVAPAVAAAMPAGGAGAPLYGQAKTLRRRAAWTDLRKGVILAAIGVGWVLHSMFRSGSPSGFGLVLLFLGLGYLVLWYFENRQMDASGAAGPRDGPPGSA